MSKKMSINDIMMTVQTIANENGEELWQKTLGTKNNDEASAVVQAVDEGFFIAGNISSNKNLFGSKDIFVTKLDKAGKLLNTTILV